MRTRIMGVLVAALAMSAVATASASANHIPTYGRCLKVKPAKSGVYGDPGCTTTGGTKAKEYEWYPAVEGAKPIVDGRNTKIPKYESGNFLTPTILDGLPSTSQLANTEIFGPVLSLVHANSIDEAMEFLRRSPYGNQASLFTTSGSAARKFRYEAPAGNIGINIGVAAPMAYFPFSGWKESFFGILHGQGRDAVEFFTESKIVIERWSRQETRKF